MCVAILKTFHCFSFHRPSRDFFPQETQWKWMPLYHSLSPSSLCIVPNVTHKNCEGSPTFFRTGFIPPPPPEHSHNCYLPSLLSLAFLPSAPWIKASPLLAVVGKGNRPTTTTAKTAWSSFLLILVAHSRPFRVLLKGQCHEIFCFWFFLWISFPPAPEYPIKTVSNFFQNSRRYSQ